MKYTKRTERTAMSADAEQSDGEEMQAKIKELSGSLSSSPNPS